MDAAISTEQTYVGWAGVYPTPPYINHPSPAAAAALGGNYANAPEFMPAFLPCTACYLINMSGSRRTDRRRLRAQVPVLPANLQNYDCHHIYDFNNNQYNPQCSAQFILRANHVQSYQHAGGVYQYETFFGVNYRNAIEEEFESSLATPDVFRTPAASSLLKDVERFEQTYRALPGWLKELYLEGRTVAPAYRFGNGRLEYVQALAPLFAAGKDDCGIDTVLDLGVFDTPILHNTFTDAVPFAFDPCGNIFLASGNDVYFFDHESSACEAVTAVESDAPIPPEDAPSGDTL